MINSDDVCMVIVLSIFLGGGIGALLWAYFQPVGSSKLRIPPAPDKKKLDLHIRIAELESENKEQKALIKDLLDENYYLSCGRGIPAYRMPAKPPKPTGVIKPNDGCTSTRSK